MDPPPFYPFHPFGHINSHPTLRKYILLPYPTPIHLLSSLAWSVGLLRLSNKETISHTWPEKWYSFQNIFPSEPPIPTTGTLFISTWIRPRSRHMCLSYCLFVSGILPHPAHASAGRQPAPISSCISLSSLLHIYYRRHCHASDALVSIPSDGFRPAHVILPAVSMHMK